MFKIIKNELQESFAKLVKDQQVLFITNIDKDKLWEIYINSFEDPAIKQQHNCNCCRQFIKNYGNVVAIQNNRILSMWNFIPSIDIYTKAVITLHTLISNSIIENVFVSDTANLGTDSNIQRLESGVITWSHFYTRLPKEFRPVSTSSIDTIKANFRDNKNVLKRSLDEITQNAIETVLELIGQNSIYRGEEFKHLLMDFLAIKKQYKDVLEKDNYSWITSTKLPSALNKIINSAIGTLLVDLSEDRSLDEAVGAFERMVAPSNYKRPTALVTKRMIEEAEKSIKEMGIEDSLERRFATKDDVTINNILFVDRNVKTAIIGNNAGIFNLLKEDIQVNPKSFSKIEEISIEKFITDVLPTIKSLEVLPENNHLNNFVSLIAPRHAYSPNLFKWSNSFSWHYTNAVADSIKEQVKAAGGKVDGVLRFSIQWNEDGKSIIDLDAHAHEPNGTHIFFSSNFRKDRGNYRTPMSGQLDLDMINPRSIGIENIAWENLSKMQEGIYNFAVHNYSGHRNFDGVRTEIEFNGEIYQFSVDKPFTGYTAIAEVRYSKANGFSIKSSLDSKSSINSKEKWGINTNKFQKVSMVTTSPNYWNDAIGNKHFFFMLENAKNDENTRGFFNEFLKEDLLKNKRVFEVLGSKLKVEPSNEQLSGLGFSSTQKNTLICKAVGKFERILKINF